MARIQLKFVLKFLVLAVLVILQWANVGNQGSVVGKLESYLCRSSICALEVILNPPQVQLKFVLEFLVSPLGRVDGQNNRKLQ